MFPSQRFAAARNRQRTQIVACFSAGAGRSKSGSRGDSKHARSVGKGKRAPALAVKKALETDHAGLDLQRVAKVEFNLEHYPEASKVMLEQTPMQNEETLSALSSVTSVAGHAGGVEKWP
eukprot:scaffold111029_cov70-Phaeocystis_antarctica.AAC.4